MALLKRKRMFLPYPPVTCPWCGHYGTPSSLKCEVCGEDLSSFYIGN